VAVLGDESMTLGFRLAGVKEYSQVRRGDHMRFESELERMLGSNRYSVLIVDEEQLSNVSPALKKRIINQMFPLVIGVPDSNGGGQSSDPLREWLTRTLGIEAGVHKDGLS